MGTRCRTLLLFTAVVSLAGGIAYAQDAPSLGDLARQQRQQKEKSKTASSKDASSPKVITNEQISGHASVALTPVATNGEKTDPPASSDSAKKSAEDWKSQIQDQRISRPNRRQHAPTGCGETKAAEGAQDFRRQLALQRAASVGVCVPGLFHEAERLVIRQLWSASVILPQVRAEVTKTCS